MLLRTQKLSVGSSSLHPTSGIHYIRSEDVLVLSLFDGSFHVLHNVSSDPSWTSTIPNYSLTSEKLSAASRSVFSEVEQGEISYSDVNRICGMIPYDSSATILWVHEYAMSIITFLTCSVNFLIKGHVDRRILPTSMMPGITACSSQRSFGPLPIRACFSKSS